MASLKHYIEENRVEIDKRIFALTGWPTSLRLNNRVRKEYIAKDPELAAMASGAKESRGLDPAAVEKIRRLRRLGVSTPAIAERVGCSSMTAWRYCRDIETTRESVSEEMDHPEDQAVERRRDGWSEKLAAGYLRLTWGSVWQSPESAG